MAGGGLEGDNRANLTIGTPRHSGHPPVGVGGGFRPTAILPDSRLRPGASLMGKRRPAQPLASTPRTLHGSRIVATLDLHGMNAHQAESRVAGFLRARGAEDAGEVVEIISGKGNHSAEGPVLQGLVRDLLDHEFAEFVADVSLARGGGGWLVRLKR